MEPLNTRLNGTLDVQGVLVQIVRLSLGQVNVHAVNVVDHLDEAVEADLHIVVHLNAEIVLQADVGHLHTAGSAAAPLIAQVIADGELGSAALMSLVIRQLHEGVPEDGHAGNFFGVGIDGNQHRAVRHGLLFPGSGSLANKQNVDNVVSGHLRNRCLGSCLHGLRGSGLRRAGDLVRRLGVGIGILGQLDDVHLLQLAVQVEIGRTGKNQQQHQNNGNDNQKNLQPLFLPGLLGLFKTSTIAHVYPPDGS